MSWARVKTYLSAAVSYGVCLFLVFVFLGVKSVISFWREKGGSILDHVSVSGLPSDLFLCAWVSLFWGGIISLIWTTFFPIRYTGTLKRLSYQGAESVILQADATGPRDGGVLVLTDERLVFLSNWEVHGRNDFALPLSSISSIKAVFTLSIFTNHLFVKCLDGKELDFWTWSNYEFEEQFESLRMEGRNRQLRDAAEM
jgi:hypothetical protein